MGEQEPNGIYCISQHFAVWYTAFKENSTPDFGKPCEECKHQKYCSVHHYPWIDLVGPVLEGHGIPFTALDKGAGGKQMKNGNTIKAAYIAPFRGVNDVFPVRIKHIPNTLEAFQKAVGGFIECCTLTGGLVAICNEEGLFLQLPFSCRLCGIPFFGNVVVVADGGDGTFRSLRDDELIFLGSMLQNMKLTLSHTPILPQKEREINGTASHESGR